MQDSNTRVPKENPIRDMQEPPKLPALISSANIFPATKALKQPSVKWFATESMFNGIIFHILLNILADMPSLL